MTIAEPANWGDQRPTVPQGYAISAIATDLQIPRQTLLLPNGDILVAEGRGGNAPKLKPKDVIAGYIKAKGTSSVKSGNRLTLLRDADGDGVYEVRTVFADNLNAPYGLALVDGNLFVANQDALVRFEYQDGETRASAPPVKVTDLPSAINHHWTKALAASADGQFLYVGYRLQQQHHRARHDSGGRPRDGMAGGCAHRSTQALCHGPAQSHRARHPARYGPAVGSRERTR